MKQKTIYSTLCACCKSVVLSDRPLALANAENAVSVVQGGGRAFVFFPPKEDPLDGLCTIVEHDLREMRMLPSDAEMWLIHGSSR